MKREMALILCSVFFGISPVFAAGTDTSESEGIAAITSALNDVNQTTLAPTVCNTCSPKKVILAYSDGGAGSGGGGDKREAELVKRFWEVLGRVDRIDTEETTEELLLKIKRTLKRTPLKIEFVSTLVYCDTNQPIDQAKEGKKQAWGCPGRLQLLPSFDQSDDSLIFHELTRITPGYTHADDGMRISIGQLKLNIRQKKSVSIEEVFPKSRYSEAFVRKEADLRTSGGARAVGIEETSTDFVLITYWPVTVGPGEQQEEGFKIPR